MRWIFNQINMKQTFIKYLPCARLWTIYTKTIKNNKIKTRPGPCPRGAHSLLEATPTNTAAKHQGGTVKRDWFCLEDAGQASEMETMELGLG